MRTNRLPKSLKYEVLMHLKGAKCLNWQFFEYFSSTKEITDVCINAGSAERLKNIIRKDNDGKRNLRFFRNTTRQNWYNCTLKAIEFDEISCVEVMYPEIDVTKYKYLVLTQSCVANAIKCLKFFLKKIELNIETDDFCSSAFYPFNSKPSYRDIFRTAYENNSKECMNFLGQNFGSKILINTMLTSTEWIEECEEYFPEIQWKNYVKSLEE